ncbi:MAG: substrate-binding domain-containing protein [Planctomycetota bacterium]
MNADASSSDRGFSLYWGIDGRDDIEDYRRLIADARANRVAGVIFTNAVFPLARASLLEESPVPMVAIQTRPADADVDALCGHMPSVYPDGRAFFEEAMRHLHGQQRRRVAVLANGLSESMQSSIMREAQASGLDCPSRYVQCPSLHNPQAVRNALELIFSSDTRPDALILADDHLVPDATRVLADVSIRIPDDLDVVAHCNSPAFTESFVPVTRLGFAACDVLAACVDAIDLQRRGEKPEPMRWISPRFFDDQRAMPPLHVAFPSTVGEASTHAGSLVSSFEPTR